MGAIYDRIGRDYVSTRRPDPRIAAQIAAALGDAESVVNVGAGAGSYEPADRSVLAVEPSQVMVAQRPPGSAPAVVASAEKLPLAENGVDAAMTALSLHHWTDWRAGIAEMRRVARKRIVVFSWSPERGTFWLARDYLAALMEWDATRFPSMTDLLAALPGASVASVPIPRDCTDGFLAAFWARPEAYLDPAVQSGMSLFTQGPRPDEVAAALERLRRDLDSGAWHERYSGLLDAPSIDAGYFLLTFEHES